MKNGGGAAGLGNQQIPPHLAKLCHTIDEHFKRYVGPLGDELSAEAFRAWTGQGRKHSSADVLGYARLLAAYIPDPKQCVRFESEIKSFIKAVV